MAGERKMEEKILNAKETGDNPGATCNQHLISQVLNSLVPKDMPDFFDKPLFTCLEYNLYSIGDYIDFFILINIELSREKFNELRFLVYL